MLFHLEKLNQLIEENDLEKTLAFIKENSFQDMGQTESDEEPAPFWKRINENPRVTLPYFYQVKNYLEERVTQSPSDAVYLRLSIACLDLAIVKLNLDTPDFLQSEMLQLLLKQARFYFIKKDYSLLDLPEYNHKLISFLLLKCEMFKKELEGKKININNFESFKLLIQQMIELNTKIISLYYQLPYLTHFYQKKVHACKERINKINECLLSVKKELEEKAPLQKKLAEFDEKFAMEKTALENKFKDVSAFMDFNRLDAAIITLQEREQIIDKMQKYYDEHPELHCDEIQKELNVYQTTTSNCLGLVEGMIQTQENSKLQVNEEQDEKAQIPETNEIDNEFYDNTPGSNKSDDGLSPIPITSLSLHSKQYQSDNSYKHKQKSCSRGDFPSSNHSALFNREFKPTPQSNINNINSNDNNINSTNTNRMS